MSLKSLAPRLPRDKQRQRSRDQMIDLLLLGIIAAYPAPTDKVNDLTRLARAREALFGEKNKKGRKSTHNLIRLFPIIAEALKGERDRMMRMTMGLQKPDVQAEWKAILAEAEPTFRGLAKKHTPSFANAMTQEKSTEDWLRRAIKNISVTAQDMAELSSLYYGDGPKAAILRSAFESLNDLGIASKSTIGIETTEITTKQN